MSTQLLLKGKPCNSTVISYLILIKHVKDEGSKLGGVSEGEELLVDLLKARGVQLSAGTVLNEAFIPAHEWTRGRKRLLTFKNSSKLYN